MDESVSRFGVGFLTILYRSGGRLLKGGGRVSGPYYMAVLLTFGLKRDNIACCSGRAAVAPDHIGLSGKDSIVTQTVLRIGLLIAGMTCCAFGNVSSTFDTNNDGWTLFQNSGPNFDWIASGGNPGGHIGATDNTSDWAYVSAPSKFVTAAQYNQTFSFDLRHDNLQQPTGFPGIFSVRVGLQGAGFTLINEGALPTLNWLNYSFQLNESSAAGWRKFSNLSQNYSAGAPLVTQAEMQAVLAGLTRIVISTDYTLASTDSNVPQIDRTYIDNVLLTTAETPEPATLAMLGFGMAAWVMMRRRHNRSY
ncbi:MAG: PEP-CTERM sorting domain-containing protein [Acidobacteria bacterium]|nr:PEP-CTERM sorting domain-containing protein [Acidobacteriota bacterium]